MLLVLALLLAQAAQQTPPRDTKPRPSVRMATIAGRVVDAETSSPIVGALVRVGRMQLPVTEMSVESGSGGQFEVRDLPEGTYSIVVSPPPLQATHLSHVVNDDFATLVAGVVKPSVELKAGDVRGLVIRLERAAAVEGRVIGEDGEGLANLTIVVERPNGGPISRAGREVRSDDRGMFRVFALPAGPLRICAVPGGNQSLGTSSAGERARRRFTKTCVPSDGEHQPLVLRAGADTPVVTIQMQRSGTFAISGRASSESGSTDLNVMVTPRESWSSGGDAASPAVKDGHFTVPGLSPGEYTVTVSARFERIGLNESVGTEYGGAVVRVIDSDVTGIELLATRGATVRGRLVSEGPLPRGVALQVAAVDPLEFAGLRVHAPPRPAAVRPDRTFEIAGVRDRALWDVIGLPEGWAVTAVRYRGTDVTDSATKFSSTSDPAELEIIVSPGAARLFIRSTGANAGAALRALVFSAAGDRQVVSLQVAQKVLADGTLELPAVRSGEYLVAVIAAQDLPLLVRTPGRIAALKRVAQRVVLASGERRTIELPLTALAELR